MDKNRKRELIRKLYQDYTEDFDHTDGKIKLKLDHTYRVASICDRLADSLGLEGEEKDLAWTLGMLHDIGRFKQVREYGTFLDAQSIDHALCSVMVLFEDGLLRKYLDETKYDSILFTAIRHHNVYRLPENLDEKTLLFCNLLRDADKIDILKVNYEIPLTTIYGPEAANAPKEIVTQATYDDFMNEIAVLRSNKTNSLDHIVGHASLVFELVFEESIKIVKEQGYLEKLLQYPVETEAAKVQFEEMRKKMDAFLKRRIH